MIQNFARRVRASIEPQGKEIDAVTYKQFLEWDQKEKDQYLRDHPMSSFRHKIKKEPGYIKPQKAPGGGGTYVEHQPPGTEVKHQAPVSDQEKKAATNAAETLNNIFEPGKNTTWADMDEMRGLSAQLKAAGYTTERELYSLKFTSPDGSETITMEVNPKHDWLESKPSVLVKRTKAAPVSDQNEQTEGKYPQGVQRKRVRDPYEGPYTEFTLPNGKIVRVQKQAPISTGGLGGWHDLDAPGQYSYVGDTEEDAFKTLYDKEFEKEKAESVAPEVSDREEQQPEEEFNTDDWEPVEETPAPPKQSVKTEPAAKPAKNEHALETPKFDHWGDEKEFARALRKSGATYKKGEWKPVGGVHGLGAWKTPDGTSVRFKATTDYKNDGRLRLPGKTKYQVYAQIAIHTDDGRMHWVTIPFASSSGEGKKSDAAMMEGREKAIQFAKSKFGIDMDRGDFSH